MLEFIRGIRVIWIHKSIGVIRVIRVIKIIRIIHVIRVTIRIFSN